MTEEPAPRPPAAGTRPWLWGRWRAERRRADELLKRAQWLQAELENVRKAAERDRAQAGERAVHALLARFLPALDSLDAALQGQEGPHAEGLRLVRQDLEKSLAAEGLAPIRAEGQAYDPALHEAVRRTERPCVDEERPGLLVEQELRRGYTVRGRVLRPAMVQVVELTPRAPEEKGPDEQEA